MQPIAMQAADLFYGRLFEIAPHVRGLFPEDLSEQKQQADGHARHGRRQPAQAATRSCPRCGTSDAGTRAMASPVEHYQPVGAALIWTLETGLGDAFTPAVKAAWLEAYTTLVNVMMVSG